MNILFLANIKIFFLDKPKFMLFFFINKKSQSYNNFDFSNI